MTGIHLLQVLMPLHVGEGARVGAVALPITRERHTDWPFVPGSAIKGALRARAEGMGAADAEIERTFGSQPAETPLRRGEMEFGDATLLLLPVRSFHQTFVLLASPLSLGRLARAHPSAPAIPEPVSAEHVLAGTDFDAEVPGGHAGIAIFEDLCVIQAKDPRVTAWQEWLRSTWIGNEAPLKHMVVVHDDLFAWAARAWVPTRTRNAIDPTTGVVDSGKLFTVEYLPPEAILWTRVSNRPAGSDLVPADGDAWAIGGHRSTGAGRVTLWQEKV